MTLDDLLAENYPDAERPWSACALAMGAATIRNLMEAHWWAYWLHAEHINTCEEPGALPGEVWRDVVGVEWFQVSSFGRLRSQYARGCRGKPTGRWAIRRSYRRADGHLYMHLYRGRGLKDRTESIHRLVLESFVGPCPERKEGCHENGCPYDNRLWNLYWGTRKQNVADTLRHGRSCSIGSRSNFAKLSEGDVSEILSKLALGESVARVAEGYSVSINSIYRIVNNKTWRHVSRGA